jgi:Flp pilus assembly protein TadG
VKSLAHIPRSARGAAAVEFAIVSLIFFILLLGAVEMGRLLWTLNAAVEATRLGARLAVVCPTTSADAIRTRMRERLGALGAPGGVIHIDTFDCGTGVCQSMRVSLERFEHRTIIPLVGFTISLPPFTTTLRKEWQDSPGNPICL